MFTKKELLEFEKATSTNDNEVDTGTVSEYWLGCPLIAGDNKIGAIVVQSYQKKNKLTIEDRDLLSFVSELLAMVLENKRLENEQLEYQSKLEIKIEL